MSQAQTTSAELIGNKSCVANTDICYIDWIIEDIWIDIFSFGDVFTFLSIHCSCKLFNKLTQFKHPRIEQYFRHTCEILSNNLIPPDYHPNKNAFTFGSHFSDRNSNINGDWFNLFRHLLKYIRSYYYYEIRLNNYYFVIQNDSSTKKPLNDLTIIDHSRNHSPIMLACLLDSVPVLQLLLAIGSDTNKNDSVKFSKNRKTSDSGTGGNNDNDTRVALGVIDFVIDINEKTNIRGETALHICCKNGSTKCALYLLSIGMDLGIDIFSRSISHKTPFYHACEKGDATIVKTMIEFITKAKEISKIEQNIKYARLKDLELNKKKNRIENKLDIEHKNNNDNNINTSSDGAVEYTSKYDNYINLGVVKGTSPLMVCSNLECVGLLLKDKSINVNHSDRDGNTPLIYSMTHHHSVEKIELLLKHKDIIISQINNAGKNILHVACQQRMFGYVNAIVNSEFHEKNSGETEKKNENNNDNNPNELKTEEDDIVVWAPRGRSTRMRFDSNGKKDKSDKSDKSNIDSDFDYRHAHWRQIEQLINARDRKLRTPLTIATSNNDTKIMKLLITRGADINIAGPAQLTPLMTSCIHGYKDSFNLLLKNTSTLNFGSMIDKVDSNGRSALILAVIYGRVDIVAALLSRNADILIKDSGDMNIFHHACCNNHKRIVEYIYTFVKTTYKPNADTFATINKNYNGTMIYTGENFVDTFINLSGGNRGFNGYHYACENGHDQIIKYLVNDCQINVLRRTGKQQTGSLGSMVAHGHNNISTWLMQKEAEAMEQEQAKMAMENRS